MPHLRFALAVASLLLVLVSTTAPAQTAEPRGISAAAGAGITFPFDPYYENDQFTWHASARFPAVRHVSFELTFDRWVDDRSQVRRDVNLYGPNGIHGHVDEVRVDGRISHNILGVGALLEGTTGRTTIAAGGGPAVFIHGHRHSEVFTGCTATPPRTCTDSVSEYVDGVFWLYGAVDVAVRLTPRLSTFARASVRGDELGLIAGLRISAKEQTRVSPRR